MVQEGGRQLALDTSLKLAFGLGTSRLELLKLTNLDDASEASEDAISISESLFICFGTISIFSLDNSVLIF